MSEITRQSLPAQLEPELRAYFESVFGEARFHRMLEALTVPSSKTTLRVNSTKTNSEEVRQKLLEHFAGDQGGDYSIEVNPDVQGVITIQSRHPRHTVHDYTSEVRKEVMISRKTGEAVLRGADVFVPGVLATTSGLEKGNTVLVSIYIGRETVTRGTVLPGDIKNSDRFLIGTGECQLSRKELFRGMHGLAVKMRETLFQSPPCNGLLRGDAMLQNLPSIIAAHVVEAQSGWRVLDMCAAPGGKTTALAEFMYDQGEIVALDRTNKKAASVVSLAEELSLSCIIVYKMDATKSLLRSEGTNRVHEVPNRKVVERLERKAATRLRCKQAAVDAPISISNSPGFAPESFDAVLLDAPCSALGLRPRLEFPQTLHDLEETARYQRRLLDTAVHHVKPGGTLVYSTCTINPGENEANVRYVLDRYPELQLAQQRPHLGSAGLIGSSWLTSDEAPLVQRFYPDGAQDTIGFFIAKFEKNQTSHQLQQPF